MVDYYGTVGDDHVIVPANGEYDYDFVYALTGSDVIEFDSDNKGTSRIFLEDGGDTIYGGTGRSYVTWAENATIENTTFYGGAGVDIVGFGYDGVNAIHNEIGENVVLDGGDGKDRFYANGRGAFIHLENGTVLIGPENEPGVFREVTIRNFEEIDGTPGHDIFVGSDVGEHLRGLGGDDLLSGREGTDRLEGGDGDDILVGGRGADALHGGGGTDIYRFDRLVESLPGREDTIFFPDHVFTDIIDVSRIDADLTAAGNQAFTFIGTASFSGAAGELRWESTDVSTCLISADADGDGTADFAVRIDFPVDLTESDFIL